MFLRMIQKEIVQHVLSLRFAVTFVLFIVLVFASVFVTTNEYVRQREQHDSLASEAKKRLEEICAIEEADDAVRTLAWWEGKKDAIPISPLSWFGQGMQGAYPPAVVTKADRVSRRVDRGQTAAAAPGSSRIPDFVYVVNVVLSLLAILLLFDSVCGEKEAGTLRLMLTNSVPRAQLLLAKWVGGYVVLLVPFLLATAGAVVYALAKGAFTSDQAGAVLFLVFTACLYIAVFFNISLFVSTTTSRSATSLLVCLLVWVMAVLVVPNMAPVTAQILAPTPSQDKIKAEQSAIQREVDLKISRLTLTSGELSYGDKVESEEDELRAEGERLKKKWDQYYEDRRRSQAELAAALGRISPATSWTYAAASITNTGFEAHERQREARVRLGEEMAKFYHEAREASHRDGEWTHPQPEDVPTLQVITPDATASLNEAMVDVLILIIMNVVFFMLAFTFFLRYDVR